MHQIMGGIFMKMGEYQDYVRILFDKYLSPIFYIVGFVLAVPQFYILYNHKFPVDKVLEIIGILVIVILMFYGARLSLVYLPKIFYSLIQKLVKTAKKDIQNIHEKHNTNESH